MPNERVVRLMEVAMGKAVGSLFVRHPLKFTLGVVINLGGVFALVALIAEAV